MPSEAPPFLADLAAANAAASQRAWSRFLDEYSPLMLHIARSLGGSHDDMMDRYTHVVDSLRADGCRKLVSFGNNGRGTFRTWFIFVVRNLCIDAYRQRYGRAQSTSHAAKDARFARRQLADMLAVDIESLPVAASTATDLPLREEELGRALELALETLSTHDRLLIRLRFEHDLSVPQVARATGYANAFKVYREFDRIFAHLRAGLRAYGVLDPSA